MIPDSFIQELLARVDVVEVVGRYVQLKKGGANYSGLCPFHSEKRGSFTVSPAKQFFHCFGCGKNGNAIGFLMEHAGMGFVDAVRDLAGQIGLQVPDERGADGAGAARREKQATLADVLQRAAEHYAKQLRGADRAVAYLRGRGVTGETAARYRLGFAPEGWRSLASAFPSYDDPLLVESGLVIANEEDGKRYDRFRDRVMFPIRNVAGACIGFGGRVLGDGTPKYLNSPETPVFSKGRELYGLFEARAALREHGYALITEGYMDVVMLAQLGFPNAVATLGTACTVDHLQKIFRFTEHVVFSFDGDAAGRRAARKALEVVLPLATDLRSVRFLFLPAEHDPDSFIRERGADAFKACVAAAVPLSRQLVDAAREGCDLSAAEGRARMAAAARSLWLPLPAGVLKQQLLAEISRLVQLPAAELARIWGGSASASASASRKRTPLAGQQHGAPAPRAMRLLQLVLADAQCWRSLSQDDRAVLAALAPPYGPLFAWLEVAYEEHGPQTPGELRQALRGREFESLALLASERAASIEPDLEELQALLAKERQARPATAAQPAIVPSDTFERFAAVLGHSQTGQ